MSIFYDSQNRKNSFVYIGTNFYREGALVQDYEIIEIQPGGVRVMRKGAAEPEFLPVEKSIATKDASAQTLTIQSISFNEKDPSQSLIAVKNKLYRQGDTVEGFHLIGIDADGVWVKKKTDLKHREKSEWKKTGVQRMKSLSLKSK
jgi:hypothetical protein